MQHKLAHQHGTSVITGLDYWTQMHAKRYVAWVLIYVPLAVSDVYSYCYLPMQVWRTRTREWKLSSLELTLRHSAITLNSILHCENHLVKLLLQFQFFLNWYVPQREFNWHPSSPSQFHQASPRHLSEVDLCFSMKPDGIVRRWRILHAESPVLFISSEGPVALQRWLATPSEMGVAFV